MKVAVIQTASLPYEKAKINYFLSILRSKGVKLVLIPEYVLNLFFKNLENTPLSFIKKQSENQIKLFKKLSRSFNLTIVAPVVVVEKEKPYKVFIKFSPKSVRFYYQQIFKILLFIFGLYFYVIILHVIIIFFVPGISSSSS